MKTLFTITMSAILGLAIFTGCGDSEKKTAKTTYRCGYIADSDSEAQNCTENEVNINGTVLDNGVEYANYMVEEIPYNSVTELLLALDSGKIEFVYADSVCIHFLAKAKNGYRVIPDDWTANYSMSFRNSDKELLAAVNRALAEIKNNGKLDSLMKEYVKNTSPDIAPAPVLLPEFKDARTIKVGLTGALPPMDYTAADGKPAGFSLALLAEIAKILKVNVAPVVVEPNSKMIALTNGKIDIAFWNLSWNNLQLKNTDKIVFSDVYFSSKAAGLYRADFKDRTFWQEYHKFEAKDNLNER